MTLRSGLRTLPAYSVHSDAWDMDYCIGQEKTQRKQQITMLRNQLRSKKVDICEMGFV